MEKQDLFLECIPSCVSEDQNMFLTSIPSSDEIYKAIFSFEGGKAPGPHGFPLLFFHKYWHIIGADICNGVKEFFGSRNILKELNGTLLLFLKSQELITWTCSSLLVYVTHFIRSFLRFLL